ncbi:MAG TPA: flagellar motor stator protein MotA [Verrucomicrobiae bacterium]|nr:flagellar motor stator protein MotA [Verrucomicrobiae bacterium]
MIVIVGTIVVLGAVLGGFTMAGGNIGALVHISEFVTIGGAATGALIVMSPKKVLVDIAKGLLQTLKGAPYSRQSYEDLMKALYEMFMLGRREGMIALEEHVNNPKQSSILSKYPSVVHNEHAVEFLVNSLRPIVDGRVKPDQLRALLDTELGAKTEEHHAPIGVLVKVADSLPGFGIVAAVLGIIVTMGAIAGPPEQIGEKVAAALVGTFLGILLSYGFAHPLASNMEFIGIAELSYLRCIASAVVAFANGMAPIVAVEIARRGLSSDVRPTSEEMETMLKTLNTPAKG